MNANTLRVVLLLCLVALPSRVQPATSDENELAALHFVSGAYVAEPTVATVLYTKVSARTLQTAVELRLRKTGFNVLTVEEALSSEDMPYLEVEVNAMEPGGFEGVYIFTISLSLKQAVYLPVEPYEFIWATTWRRSTFGKAGASIIEQTVRETVSDLTDEFINDWLAAISKERLQPEDEEQKPARQKG